MLEDWLEQGRERGGKLNYLPFGRLKLQLHAAWATFPRRGSRHRAVQQPRLTWFLRFKHSPDPRAGHPQLLQLF